MDWEAWSRCSVTCGDGLKFRTRRCNKYSLSDKDCYGVMTEDAPCSMNVCTGKVINMFRGLQHSDGLKLNDRFTSP